MNSNMDQRLHHQAVQRALELGRGTDPAALPELMELLKMPSSEVRRLAASAIASEESNTKPRIAGATRPTVANHCSHSSTR